MFPYTHTIMLSVFWEMHVKFVTLYIENTLKRDSEFIPVKPYWGTLKLPFIISQNIFAVSSYFDLPKLD